MSKRRRAAIAALCIASAALFVWLDNKSPQRPLQDKSAPQARARDTEKYHGGTFTVSNVVDGDTIDIDVPDGEYERTRIRLWGIDTPESWSPKVGEMYFGPQAAEFTKKLALGRDVRVFLDEDNRTRCYYGRLLAYVQLPDKRFLNEVLLSEGYAYADVRFRHSHYNKYKQLESAARGQRRGLWADVTRDQLPQWLQKEKPTLLLEK